MLRGFFVIAFLMSCFIVTGSNAASEVKSVKAIGFISKNSARILFRTSNSENITHKVSGQKLHVYFNDKIKLSARNITKNLGKYINKFEISQDKKEIILFLTSNKFQTRQFAGDGFIAINIINSQNNKLKYRKNIPLPASKPESFLRSKNSVISFFEQYLSSTKPLINSIQNLLPQENEKDKEKNSKLQIGPLAAKEIKKLEQHIVKPPPIEKPLEALVEINKKDVEIIFPWKKETPAVIFRRGNYITALFQTKEDININALKKIKYFENIFVSNFSDFFILRFKIKRQYIDKIPVYLSVNSSANKWVVNIYENNKKESLASKQLQLSVKKEDEKFSLLLNANEKIKVFKYIDESVGDTLFLVPLNSEAYFANDNMLIDLQIISSQQGVVIRKISQNLQYKVVKQKLVLYGKKGLNVDKEFFARILKNNLNNEEGDNQDNNILPFNYSPNDDLLKNDEDSSKNFIKNKQILYNYLSTYHLADQDDNNVGQFSKSDIRLSIAKYYFAQSMYHEALGVLQYIQKNDPQYSNIEIVDFISASSKYLLHRYLEANNEFKKLLKNTTLLKNNSELLLWEWLSYYKFNKKIKKAVERDIPIDYISNIEKFVQSYPESLRFQIGLIIAENYIENGELNTASNIIDIITYTGIPTEIENDINFIKAKIAENSGDTSRALSIWGEISKDVDDRFNRARSIYEMTKTQLIHGIIDTDQAVEKFSKVGTIWRGDSLELDVLKVVGKLYIEQKRYADGLRAWKILVKIFPSTKEALFVAGKMKDVFIDLFQNGEAYKMTPFEALTLYFEFKELTPVGKQGDEITINLAQHFVNADLLRDAQEIMEHQIRFRTSGEARHALTVRLVQLYLKDNQPQAAIDAINKIRKENISEQIKAKLKYLEAHSYAILHDYYKVIGILKDDFSPSAQDIRLKLFWDKNNWFGIMNIIEPLIPEMSVEGRVDLNENEVKKLIMLSMAYGMQEEFAKNQSLKGDFLSKIYDPKANKIFSFITEKVAKINFEDFDNTIDLEYIEGFIDDYAFWPDQNWKYTANILSNAVEKLIPKSNNLNDQEKDLIIRLALAYSMQINDKENMNDEKKLKLLVTKLKKIQSDFRNVKIDQTTIRTLKNIDDKFIPIEEDVLFSGKVNIADIPEFIKKYQSASSFSELNILESSQ